MRASLIASLLVHTAILLAAVVVLPAPQEYEAPDEEAVLVEIVDISEFSKRVAQSTSAKEDVEKPAPEEVEKEAPVSKPLPEPVLEKTTALPPIEEEVEIPPLPEKAPEPSKEVEKKPEPEPLPKEEPKKEEAKVEKPKAPAPRPRAKPKKKLVKKKEKKKKKPKFDLAAIEQALIDKSVDKAALQKKFEEIGKPKKANVNSTGKDNELSATEKDWLIQHLVSCWNLPTGVQDADKLKVVVEYSLDIDGFVLGSPVVKNRDPRPVFQVASDSVVRAVLSCQPYDRFNKENYRAWKRIRVNFDPKSMFQS